VLGAGAVFAGYRIERVLGAGGMGVVYLARSPELPRFDALKVLSAELSRDADFRARFVREADVAAVLDHPNIVVVHRRGECDGQLWIAMQFVDGTDADAALRAGAMTPARAVHLIGQVAKALDYAHQRQVVHRDVKPANILLSGPVGSEERVLLGDFGLARALDDVGLTATGSVLATLSFVAPEVLAGQPFDGRADVYSLGCTLFRLLTGKTPFSAANGVAAVVAAHLHAPPPKVTDVVPGLSGQLDAVIATALAKDPAQRFATARALADAAAGALADRSVGTTAPWQPIPNAQVDSYPPASQSTGPPWWQHSGGTGTVMAPAPPAHRWPGPPAAPAVTGSPPRRRRRWIAAALAAVAVAAAGVTAVILTTRSQTPTAATTSSTPTSTGPPPVPVSALPAMLLPPDQVAGIVGSQKMVVYDSETLPYDSVGFFSDPQCVGVWMPAEHAAYAATGWTAVQAQRLRDDSDKPFGHEVMQTVVAFPSAAVAQKAFADQAARWSSCAGRSFTIGAPNPTQHRTFGPLSNTGGILAIASTLDGTLHEVCQHALTVRNNLAIDVAACRIDATNQGIDVLNAIAAKVPR
jgi:eukaryotic-like serine/threonine-protein kinase